jgi:hypothetical protein
MGSPDLKKPGYARGWWAPKPLLKKNPHRLYVYCKKLNKNWLLLTSPVYGRGRNKKSLRALLVWGEGIVRAALPLGLQEKSKNCYENVFDKDTLFTLLKS